MKMKTVLADDTHMKAMVKAMRAVKCFAIEKTRETVIAKHAQAGEVFRSIRGPGGLWITRHADNLFK